MGTNDTQAPKDAGDAVVLMYPGNQLKKQVREYGDTKSTPFKVLEKAFFGK